MGWWLSQLLLKIVITAFVLQNKLGILRINTKWPTAKCEGLEVEYIQWKCLWWCEAPYGSKSCLIKLSIPWVDAHWNKFSNTLWMEANGVMVAEIRCLQEVTLSEIPRLLLILGRSAWVTICLVRSEYSSRVAEYH